VRIIVLTNTLDGGSDKIAEHIYNDLFPAIASAALREGEAPQRAASAPMTDDQRLYAKTITTMRDLPEPPYLTFVTNVTLHGNVSTTLLDRHGIAVFRIWTGKGGLGQPSGSWATSHRASDDLGSIANTPQSHLLTHSALFNPTWTGAYDWLRYGVSGPQFTVKPVPVPQQSAGPDAHLTVIGVVKALSPSAYRITAAHTALCPGGEQGRHLQLAPRNGDIWVHPLTDVVIDVAQTRFCSMRFHSPAVDGVSFAELHFGSVHGYWMTTSVDTDLRQYGQLGIPGPRASWHFTYDELRFPDTLDDAIFSLPDDPVGSHGKKSSRSS
jgi:hypothetical protein